MSTSVRSGGFLEAAVVLDALQVVHGVADDCPPPRILGLCSSSKKLLHLSSPPLTVRDSGQRERES